MRRLLFAAVALSIPLCVWGQDSLTVIGGSNGTTEMQKLDVSEITRISTVNSMFKVGPADVPLPVLCPVRKLVFTVANSDPSCSTVGARIPTTQFVEPCHVRVSTIGMKTTFSLVPDVGGNLTISIHDSRGRIVKRLMSVVKAGAAASFAWERGEGLGGPYGCGAYHLTSTINGRPLSSKTFICR